jgi:hypothetical protein
VGVGHVCVRIAATLGEGGGDRGGVAHGGKLFVLAQRYDLYVDRAPAVVFLSTLISVLTVSLLLAVGR